MSPGAFSASDPGPLFHVSEDPTISEFSPRVAVVPTYDEPLVWTLDATHLPGYWFPRDCPRAMVWAETNAHAQRLSELFVTKADRLHVVEERWMQRIADADVFAYEFTADGFEPFDEIAGCWVARTTVTPVGVRPLGDLIGLHRAAGIELRAVDDLWETIDQVVSSDLPFSVVRSRNAAPRPTA